MFRIPYRWLPRTILPNLKSMWYDIYYGIQNIFRWIPIIWFDNWFDFVYLVKIMEYKLKWDAKMYDKYGCTANAHKYARQMRICAELLRRIHKDTAFENLVDMREKGHEVTKYDYEHYNLVSKYYVEYLFTLMRKHLYSWWD